MTENNKSTEKRCDIHVVSNCTDFETEKCGCGNEANGEHTCPYQEDINGDSESLCNCCDSCMQNCCDDI